MKAIRRMSGSTSHRASVTSLTVTVSRAEGSFGLGLSDDNVVTDISEKSSAASTEIQAGDRVVSVDGQPVGSRKLVSMLAENASTSVTLGLERSPLLDKSSSGGAPRSLLPGRGRSASTAKASDPLDRTGSFVAAGEQVLTLRLAKETTEQELGLEVDQNNSVTAVMWETAAYKAGLQVGDIVTKLDGKDLGETKLINCDIDVNKPLMLTVRRGVAMDKQVSFTTRRHSAQL